MPVTLSVRAVELLCSRLCHDLVSPVGAINNGVELIEETGLAEGGEALDLIADSADAAAKRLKLFRLAFGAAGGQDGISAADARAVLEGWFRGGKVALSWTAALPSAPPGFFKLLLAAGVLAEEGLPRGGSLRVDGDAMRLTLAAQGTGAALRPEVRVALGGDLPDAELTPRGIVAHVAARMAQAYGFTLAVGDEAEGRFTLALARA